ncbi:MAG: CvpA family protein [Pseudomonadota bacterium]|nr:CvpA family protein [Pseudomonadota bacterium]
MAILDVIVAGYLVWGFYQGRRRGLRGEGIRIISLLIVLTFLLGFGLFKVVGNSLAALTDSFSQTRGILVSVLLMVTTLVIVVIIRKKLRAQRASVRPAGEPALYGGIAGLLRALLMLGVILAAFGLFLPDFLNHALLDDTLFGQALERLAGIRTLLDSHK